MVAAVVRIKNRRIQGCLHVLTVHAKPQFAHCTNEFLLVISITIAVIVTTMIVTATEAETILRCSCSYNYSYCCNCSYNCITVHL